MYYVPLIHFTASYSDFEGLSQTVKFSHNKSTATAYIKIKDDNIVEKTEVFQIEILIPDSLGTYIQIGSPSKAKVYIKDGM